MIRLSQEELFEEHGDTVLDFSSFAMATRSSWDTVPSLVAASICMALVPTFVRRSCCGMRLLRVMKFVSPTLTARFLPATKLWTTPSLSRK